MKLYQKLAGTIAAIENCQKSGNTTYIQTHKDLLRYFESEYLPSGSGFDNGSKIDLQKSTPEKIVILSDYHKMSDAGYYCGWQAVKVVVKPSLLYGFTLSITGGNRKFKDYVSDAFEHALKRTVI